MNGRLFLKDLSALVANTNSPFAVGCDGGIPDDGDPLKHTILVDNSLMSFGMV